MKLIVRGGADLEVSNAQGFRRARFEVIALLMAAQHAHGALAVELLKSGARMDTATGRGFTPLMLASMYGQHDLLLDLLDRGADLNATQETGDTALSLSSFFGRPRAVAELVRRGADVRCRDDEGSAPGEVFEAEVDLPTQRQIQVLLWGEEETKEFEQVQVEKQDAVTAGDASNSTRAIDTRYRRSSTPRVVSQVGGEQGAPKAWGPLHLAIHQGSAAEVRELLRKPGVDKEALLERSFTPLSLAAQYGRADCIAELLEGGANIEARSDRAFTPLLLASKGGHLDAVRELRTAGAAVEAKNDRSFTPLLIACQNNHREVVQDLISKPTKANIEARSDQGYTALLIACLSRTLDLAVLLVANGASLSAVTKRRMSALHLAAEGGDVDLVRMLLMAGAPLETRSSTGDTPLTLATFFGHEQVVEKLLAMGANANVIDHDGHVAGRSYDEGVDEDVRKQISRVLRAAREQTRGGVVAVRRTPRESSEGRSRDSGTSMGLVAR
ncbi:unnamed protein product [Hapterophycus canaliculatus]